MEEDFIISVKVGEDCKIFSVNGQSSYDDFVKKISGHFFDLLVNDYKILCSVGGISKFRLESEDDFRNLIVLCRLSGAGIAMAEVFISQISDSVSGGRVSSGGEFGGVRCENVSVSKELVQSKSSSSLGNSNVRGEGGARSWRSEDQLVANSFSDGGFSGESSRGRSLCSDRQIVSKSISDNDQFGQQVEFGGDITVPSYDICPIQKKKALLSDNWAEIMKDRVGAIFQGGAKEFRKELRKYSTQMGFKYKFIRNGPRYVYAVCEESIDSGCDWYVKAKLKPSSTCFVIYKGNFIHKCVGSLVDRSKRCIGAAILSEIVMEKVKSNLSVSGIDIIEYVRSNYGIDITYSQAWRSIEKARDSIFGSYSESYDQLQWYCRAISRTNPGSVVSLEANLETHHFERVFIAYKACIDGFKYCRPMLFVDGTFMKGRAKGILLSATAKDGDNGLFPVAFAVVSAENTDNWVWFLQMLKDNIYHDKQVYYISDRNSGLMAAFPKVFREPVHFYCLFHLVTNLKGKFSGKLTQHERAKMPKLLTDCAYAPNKRIFEDKLKIFKQTGGQYALEWLEGLDLDKWTVAYSPHINRYGEMTSNAAESFNSWIREARCLPVTYMIDTIQMKIMRWYVDRRKVSNKWTGALCVSKEKLWNQLSDIGRSWLVSVCTNGGYQVFSTPSVIVDLRSKRCTCYEWQIKGFPCAHAVAVIRKVSKSVYSHIDECFYAEAYRMCYKSDIYPVPGTERFECQNYASGDFNILPPILNRPIGRPKKKRNRSYGEFPKSKGKQKLICDICGEIGSHDSITCLLAPVDEESNHSGSDLREDFE